MGLNSSAPPSYGRGPTLGVRPGVGAPPPGMMNTMPVGSPVPANLPPGAPAPGGMPGAPSPWTPQTSGPMIGGPKAGQMPTAPISPEGFNAYRNLQQMPVTGVGQGKKNAFNQAATQYRNQYGGGYDPSGQLQRTKALRRYGG